MLIGEIYKYIPSKYIIDSLELKAENKSVLQKTLGLSEQDVPILSVVSRQIGVVGKLSSRGFNLPPISSIMKPTKSISWVLLTYIYLKKEFIYIPLFYYSCAESTSLSADILNSNEVSMTPIRKSSPAAM